MPAVEYRPGDGMNPTTPQNAAGRRTEPLVSVPTAATLEILGARGIGVTQCEEPHELVTPTGAALLAEFVEEFGLSVVNAVGSITEQQRTFRKLVSQHLEIADHDEQLDELS